METALIASNLAEHRDIACSWVRKQGAIERDLSNETTYQELVKELQLRPLVGTFCLCQMDYLDTRRARF